MAEECWQKNGLGEDKGMGTNEWQEDGFCDKESSICSIMLLAEESSGSLRITVDCWTPSVFICANLRFQTP